MSARLCAQEELRDKLKATVQAMAPMLAHVLQKRAAAEGREMSREEFEEAMSTVVKMTAAKESGDDVVGGIKAGSVGAVTTTALDGLLRGRVLPSNSTPRQLSLNSSVPFCFHPAPPMHDRVEHARTSVEPQVAAHTRVS